MCNQGVISAVSQAGRAFGGVQGIVVAPHLMTGASDSRHYLDITANGVYRFFPLFVNLTAGDVARVHGIDERIKVCTHAQTPGQARMMSNV